MMKTHKTKAFAFLGAAFMLLIAFTFTACPGKAGGTASEAPFVTDGASLVLKPGTSTVKVRVRTADGSDVTVEGCTETSLASSSTQTTLHATGTIVILKGKITELDCSGRYDNNNNITALNVQGLRTTLQKLECRYNKLKALNIHDLSALAYLDCSYNRLTALSAQDLSALTYLDCRSNRLTALNVQGLSALYHLDCSHNRLNAFTVQGLRTLRDLNCNDNELTSLNVQGLNALRDLNCNDNELTSLDVQGLSALQKLYCNNNELTSLNVQGLNALYYLYCHKNKLTAQAFTTLLTDLPARASGDDAKCVLFQEAPDEGNYTDFTAPAGLANAFNDAKNNKNWKLCKRSGWNDVEL